MRIAVRHVSAMLSVFLLLLFVSDTLIAGAKPRMLGTAAGALIYLPMITQQLTIEQQVVDLVNQQRRQNGCMVSLTISAQLSAAANAHSRDMALNNFFGHQSSDGSDMVSRVKSTGYTFQRLAENIAIGNDTPEVVVNNWMQSPPHRANILNCELRDIGVGYFYQADDRPIATIGGPYYFYWTQDFGTR